MPLGVGALDSESAQFNWQPVVAWLADDMAERTDYNAFFAAFLFQRDPSTWKRRLDPMWEDPALEGGQGRGAGAEPMDDGCFRDTHRIFERIGELHEYQLEYYTGAMAREQMKCDAPAVLQQAGGTRIVGQFSTEQQVFNLQNLAQLLYYMRYFNGFYGPKAAAAAGPGGCQMGGGGGECGATSGGDGTGAASEAEAGAGAGFNPPAHLIPVDEQGYAACLASLRGQLTEASVAELIIDAGKLCAMRSDTEQGAKVSH